VWFDVLCFLALGGFAVVAVVTAGLWCWLTIVRAPRP
jgi:hypothetical protein